MEDGNETVLDPAHAEETVIAGVPKPEASAQKPDFKATEDGNQVEYGGHKYIREEALRSEREKAQSYANTINQLQPLMPEFEQFLAQRSQGRQATVSRAGGTVDFSDLGLTPDDVEGYAIARGYYDTNNKPDSSRAAADLRIMARVGEHQARRAVQPVANMSAEDRAKSNYAAALSRQFLDGDPVADEKYVRAAFDALRPEDRADPNVANLTSVIAAGLQHLDERRTGQSSRSKARREPAFREGGSGRVGDSGLDALDAFDRAAARARGKSPEEWGKMTKAMTGSAGTRDLTGTTLEDV